MPAFDAFGPNEAAGDPMPLPANAPAASSAERLLHELSEQDLANPAIAAAIAYLVEHYIDQPSLNELAAAAAMHPHHFQRVFKRWAGISPKRFAQYLTVEHAKRLLNSSQSVLDVALEVGLSGPSRLHDLFVACEAMTPGEYKLRGCDMEIRHGVHDTPFGPALVGVTERGVCWLGFAPDGDVASAARTSRSRCGRRCWRSRPGGSSATSNWRRRSAIPRRPAPSAKRWAPTRYRC